ncbi:MAG TPA: ATP-binding cassette domain-containing protein, partial [Vicinamibacterales bacterium]|nr:ATP-binding cassette domain-containing protein [Vicinamibacterales bacterium]
MTAPVLELTDVSKDYHGLRPLRIADLSVARGEQVALVGFDQSSAEVFMNLVTGAILPDRGAVRLLGRETADIADAADWLTVVDRVGIVSRRAVLLDALTVIQNLAMPYTLEVAPPPPDVRERAVALASDAGLPEGAYDRAIAELDATDVFRVRFARALAFDPAVVFFEHATAEVAGEDILALATRCREVASRRHIATVVLTADRVFAATAASRVLSW